MFVFHTMIYHYSVKYRASLSAKYKKPQLHGKHKKTRECSIWNQMVMHAYIYDIVNTIYQISKIHFV